MGKSINNEDLWGNNERTPYIPAMETIHNHQPPVDHWYYGIITYPWRSLAAIYFNMFQPAWKIWVRQWEGWHPIYEMENESHVWNHPPDINGFTHIMGIPQTCFKWDYSLGSKWDSEWWEVRLRLLTWFPPKMTAVFGTSGEKRAFKHQTMAKQQIIQHHTRSFFRSTSARLHTFVKKSRHGTCVAPVQLYCCIIPLKADGRLSSANRWIDVNPWVFEERYTLVN